MTAKRMPAAKTLTPAHVLRKLKKIHDPPMTFLEFRTPLDLLVATILSARCTDERVNFVTKNTLFKKYRKPGDYARADRAALEKDIQSCGTYRNKARMIQEMCRMLIDRHGSRVPESMEELVALPGVGRKTAAIVLYAAYGKNEGIAVDTHVNRLAQRLGLSRHREPEKIEADLMQALPRSQWGETTTLLISHGRATCDARKPKCDDCLFARDCPSSRVMGRKDLFSK